MTTAAGGEGGPVGLLLSLCKGRGLGARKWGKFFEIVVTLS